MKKIAAAVLCAWLAFPALASRQLTDDAGRSVTLPDRVDRIAEGWFAHHSLLMTLGAGDTIVATVNRPDSRPWMFHLTPRLNQALISRGPHFTSEALLARGAEVVFVARGNGDAEAYPPGRSAGHGDELYRLPVAGAFRYHHRRGARDAAGAGQSRGLQPLFTAGYRAYRPAHRRANRRPNARACCISSR
ncbi:Uncharacterised protein [Raoultella terrigena]|uniref:Uncharacterized protein n=1 Tax=Raoultella terrigena TaxID=577 RepID=A0A3P8IZ79_RAOTE|nr:Uncharacterised protein [Raoultella terrigena]